VTRICFILFLISGMINFAFSIRILRDLSAAGIKVGFYELRWHIHKHMKRYREISRDSSGRPAIAYYGYIVTLVLLVLFGLLTFASLG